MGNTEKQKTADQMFREMGYALEEWALTTNERWYGKTTEEGKLIIIVDFNTKYVECKLRRDTVSMTFDETLACAQLIREMEGK